MGRHEEAIETCRAGLQRHPAYLSARVTLGRALIETGEYDAARDELQTVLRSAPENLAAIRGLAQIHERLGQSTEMDPHLAAMMNAEVERVALAASAPPPAVELPAAEPPVPASIALAAVPEPVFAEPEPVIPAPMVAEPMVAEPIVAAAVEMVLDVPETQEQEDDEPSFEPDPAMIATLARLERLLVAIDAARHP